MKVASVGITAMLLARDLRMLKEKKIRFCTKVQKLFQSTALVLF